MPFLDLRLAADESPELSAAAAATLLDLTRRILGKDPALTAIAIDYLPPSRWFVGGRPLAESGRRSFFLDIRITDETNTKAEKAAYVAEVFAAFSRLLGALHPESYVHVHDVRAAAYGYGGRTQEYRYHHAAG